MQPGQLSWITNFIWNIADDVLRDLYVRGKYCDLILPMIVLRRLDAVLEPTKQAVLETKAMLDDAGIVNQEEDLSRGILETIDMDSYRVEKQTALRIALPDEDAEIGPVPTSGSSHLVDPELDRLSNILRQFNDLYGNISWADGDHIRRLISQEIPEKVAGDAAFQNARVEHDRALARVMLGVLKDDTELFKQFSDNVSFCRWLTDTVFAIAYEK